MHHQRILCVFPQAECRFYYSPSALFCPNILGLPFLGFQMIVSLLLGSCSSSKLVDSVAAAITYETVLNNPVAPLVDPSNEAHATSTAFGCFWALEHDPCVCSPDESEVLKQRGFHFREQICSGMAHQSPQAETNTDPPASPQSRCHPEFWEQVPNLTQNVPV